MKKFLALVCLLAVGMLVGCGGDKPKAAAPTGPNPSTEKTAEEGKKAVGDEAAKEGAAK
jgi:hypothetical protein